LSPTLPLSGDKRQQHFLVALPRNRFSQRLTFRGGLRLPQVTGA
jgi:hypothetical protein